jgi:DNA-binding transcriptional MerR regulator
VVDKEFARTLLIVAGTFLTAVVGNFLAGYFSVRRMNLDGGLKERELSFSEIKQILDAVRTDLAQERTENAEYKKREADIEVRLQKIGVNGIDAAIALIEHNQASATAARGPKKHP